MRVYRQVVLLLILAGAGSAGAPFIGAQGALSDVDWIEIHKKDMAEWTRKSGIEIETLIHVVKRDISEDDQYLIQMVDATSLRKRGQVVLALAGAGTAHPLTVYVLTKTGASYRELWSAEKLPSQAGCAETYFATDSVLGEPIASVTPEKTIEIRMPIEKQSPAKSDATRTHSQLLVVEYGWSGNTYSLKRVRVFARYLPEAKTWITSGPGQSRACK